MSKSKINKITTLILVITFTFSPILAIPARAQWLVYDPANFTVNTVTSVNTGVTAAAGVDTAINTTLSGPVKEFGLDAVAWLIVNLIIERMSASTVNWINNGFKGSPAFVTNPEAYFTDIGDKIAGQYIFSNPNLNFLCGPISAKIKLALTNSQSRDRQWQCTLTQVGKNMDNFMNKFENGGWDNFFELTQKTQNNPIGAYIQAENELSLQISTRQGTEKSKLDWGKGFMSWEECPDGSAPGGEDCDIKTPGSVISDQLNNVLNTGNNKLAAADEINEIVSSLLNQLVSSVVGGIGNGLKGLSKPDATGKTFTSQLSGSTKANTTDYFGNAQDTRIGNTPIPTAADFQKAGSAPAIVPPTTVPKDTDCNTIDKPTLNQMAQQSAGNLGITFNQAMLNLDCNPPGIH